MLRTIILMIEMLFLLTFMKTMMLNLWMNYYNLQLIKVLMLLQLHNLTQVIYKSALLNFLYKKVYFQTMIMQRVKY
jgi:hypothetical protein